MCFVESHASCDGLICLNVVQDRVEEPMVCTGSRVNKTQGDL